MQKSVYIMLLAAFVSISAAAQTRQLNLEYRAYPGTITTPDGQTVKGYVDYLRRGENQNKCIFFTDINDPGTMKVYKPSDLKGYSIENYQYKSVDYSGNIGFIKATRSFLFVTKAGAITTYVYSINGNEQLVWQKGDEEPVSNASMLLSFKKSMVKLVSDDADLAGKIDRKEKGYGKLDIMAIVDEYNTWATPKK